MNGVLVWKMKEIDGRFHAGKKIRFFKNKK